MKKFWICLLLWLVPASGCLSPTVKSPPSAALNLETANLKTPVEEYRINSLDLLKVTIYQEEDLERIVRVSQNGYISYPLLGKVKVIGLTTLELEEKLSKLLGKDYLVNPQVTVFIQQYHRREIFILGAVKNPGSYQFLSERELTILEAISLAGGFTEFAAKDRTKIIRVEDGVEKTIQVNISEVIKDKSKDIFLIPNDIVIVPETFF